MELTVSRREEGSRHLEKKKKKIIIFCENDHRNASLRLKMKNIKNYIFDKGEFFFPMAFPPSTFLCLTWYGSLSVYRAGIILANFGNKTGTIRCARKPVNSRRYIGYRLFGAYLLSIHSFSHFLGIHDLTAPVFRTSTAIKCKPNSDFLSTSI